MGRKYCCRRQAALSKPGSRIREQREVHWNSGTINIIDIWADIGANSKESPDLSQFETVRRKTPCRWRIHRLNQADFGTVC